MPGTDDAQRVALVTGAGSGIGGACLHRLAADGFVAVGAWRATPPASSGPSVRFDVTDAAAVAAAVAEVEDRWGPIEVLVSNAGLAHLDLALRVTPERFAEVVDTNLVGSFLLAKAVLGPMVERRRGRIVLVGSVAGHWGVPGVSSYAAAKAGLVGMARSLAREVGPRSITVNVVAPGMLDDAVERLDALRPRSPVPRHWVEATPVGRPGTVDDVAAAVSFLASAGAAFVTGAVLPVDGGFAMGLG